MFKEKVEIPRELYMAILRLQVEYDLDWIDACKKAADLIDRNSGEFKRAVKREAERIYNSRFMKQLNKAKKKIAEKIEEEAWMEGYNRAKGEYEVWYHCNVCGEPITIRPNSEDHKAMREYMREHGWGHRSCHEKAGG